MEVNSKWHREKVADNTKNHIAFTDPDNRVQSYNSSKPFEVTVPHRVLNGSMKF